MVRKIGFGEDDAEPTSKTSIADQAMERFRKKAKIKAARDAEQKKTGRSKIGRIIFLSFWLILWVAMSGAVLFTMAQEGLSDNILPLVIWTGASLLVVTKVIKSIIKGVRGERNSKDRPENF